MKILPQGVPDQKLQLLNKPGAPKPGQQTDSRRRGNAGVRGSPFGGEGGAEGVERVADRVDVQPVELLQELQRARRTGHAATVCGERGEGGRTCFTVLSDGSMSPSVTTTSLILVLVV